MDKVIIITGGAGGIGSDICRGLAADGLKVVVADYAKDAAEKTAAEIRNAKGDAAAVEVDVGSKESVAEMMKWVREGKITDVKTVIAAFWLEKIVTGQWAP